MRRCCFLCALSLAGLALLAAPAQAGDFDDFGFGLRFEAALSRFSRFADVASTGGASAGSFFGSSVNPASTSWNLEGVGFSPQYVGVDFDEGTKVHVLAASSAFEVVRTAFQASFASVTTNSATTRDGLEFEWDAYFAELLWARRVEENAFGISLGYTTSNIKFNAGPVTVSDSDSNTYTFSFGWLRQVTEPLFFGVVLDYGRTESTADMFDPGSGMGFRVKDSTDQFLFQSGISYKYKQLRAFLDYQYGYFSDDSGDLQVHRSYFGLDQEIQRWINVRAGTAVDDRGNVAFTAGIGLFPSEKAFVELAYQYDFFPEIAPEFGRSNVFLISFSFTF